MVTKKAEEIPVGEQGAPPVEVAPDALSGKSAPQDAGAVLAQLEQLNKDLSAAKEESKKHQTSLNEKASELAKRQAIDTKVDSIETRLSVLTDMMADIMDRGGEFEEEPQQKMRRSQQYTARLQGDKPKVEPEVPPEVDEVDKLVRSVGMDMLQSPELRQALLYYRSGMPSAMLEEVQKVVEAKKAETKNPDPDLIKRLVAEERRKEMEPELETDLSGPSGLSASFERIRDEMIKNPSNDGKMRRYIEAKKARGN